MLSQTPHSKKRRQRPGSSFRATGSHDHKKRKGRLYGEEGKKGEENHHQKVEAPRCERTPSSVPWGDWEKKKGRSLCGREKEDTPLLRQLGKLRNQSPTKLPVDYAEGRISSTGRPKGMVYKKN